MTETTFRTSPERAVDTPDTIFGNTGESPSARSNYCESDDEILYTIDSTGVIGAASPQIDKLNFGVKPPKVQPKTHFFRGPDYSMEMTTPLQSYEILTRPVEIPEGIKLATRADKIRQVMVIGVTGKIGSILVKQLLTRKVPPTTIHCLIRANTQAAARVRLRASLEPLFPGADKAYFQKQIDKCRVWCGDISTHRFGMTELDYYKLASRVEGIYNGVDSHIEPRKDCSKYSQIVEVKVHSWKRILDLATTHRIKHIWAFSSMAAHPAPLEPTKDNLADILVAESNVPDPRKLQNIELSPHENLVGSNIWCSVVCEAFLKYIISHSDLPVTLFRLPLFNYCSSIDIAENNGHLQRKPPFAWRMLRTFVQVGMLPFLPGQLYLLVTQPIDEALNSVIDLSFCHQRVHWVYNILDARVPEQDPRTLVRRTLRSLGIYLKDSTWQEFVNSCLDLGKRCHVADIINDLDELIKKLANSKKVEFSTSHMHQDLQILKNPVEPWNSGRPPLLVAFRSLLMNHFFSDESLGTHRSFEPIYRDCVMETGLTEMGPEGEMCREGWDRLLTELRNPEPGLELPFCSFAKLARTIHVYVKSLLFMTQREAECPEILDEKIVQPLLIVGLNRAGTTFMHSLMAMDHSRNRCPVLLELLFPYGENGDYRPVGLTKNDPKTWDLDPRRQAADELVVLQMGGEVSKKFAEVHLRLSTSYEEDLVVFEQLGRSYTQCTGFFAPKQYDWLINDDAAILRLAYRHHKRFFQHLQYQRPGKRWILKYPWHLLTIETFMETYPDSEILFMHRDPVPAVTSFCAMEVLVQKNFVASPDPKKIGRRGLEFMGRIIDKALDYQEGRALKFVEEHTHLQPPVSCFLNVYFDAFIAAPISTIHQTYEALGWESLTGTAEREMWDFIERSIKCRSLVNLGRIELSELGLTNQQVRDRFERYINAYFDPAQKHKRLQDYKIARAIRENSLERETYYTTYGTMVDFGHSWVEKIGLNPTLYTCETILSYLKTRFHSVE